jgi:hypothetical protein
MFRKKHQGPPDRPFLQADDCKLVKADPDFEPVWSEVERGHWRRECQCGAEDYRVPKHAHVRLDPLDPATMRHLPQCEFKGTTDPVILKALLKITPKHGYSWVECGAYSGGWQVLDFAEERVG